ncbi:MAG: GNAT family N-acetyltransferase [Bacteroidales bacterium]|nr:GNAT family N-acetyltransferase [Bacteroidales bacterium]
MKHGDIDATRWNETVGASGFPTVFCTYEMLDALVGGATWNALVMDDYDYVMPLPERSKFGVHYVYSPFFVSQMGIFSAKPVTAQITSDFFNALPSADKHVDLLLNQSNATDFIDSYTISLVTHTLALYKDYQELSSAYSQNTRRNVKAARKSDLVMKSDEVGVEQVVRLFQENRGQRKEVRFKPKDYEILTQAASVLKSQGLLEVLSVHTREGQLIAGALMVRDFQRYRFWFSGRDAQFADQKAMFFLLDEFIARHAGTPFLLDFNGSMNENVARLYKGFGGQPLPIKMISYSRQMYWNLLLKLYRMIRK